PRRLRPDKGREGELGICLPGGKAGAGFLRPTDERKYLCRKILRRRNRSPLTPRKNSLRSLRRRRLLRAWPWPAMSAASPWWPHDTRSRRQRSGSPAATLSSVPGQVARTDRQRTSRVLYSLLPLPVLPEPLLGLRGQDAASDGEPAVQEWAQSLP